MSSNVLEESKNEGSDTSEDDSTPEDIRELAVRAICMSRASGSPDKQWHGGDQRSPVERTPEPPRREALVSVRGRRACSEQGPHPLLHKQLSSGGHLWGGGGGGSSKRGWSRKRTSAPQMSGGGAGAGGTPRVAVVLRSRRSWPVAPQRYRSQQADSLPTRSGGRQASIY